jgi:hypothetical protein
VHSECAQVQGVREKWYLDRVLLKFPEEVKVVSDKGMDAARGNKDSDVYNTAAREHIQYVSILQASASLNSTV